MIKIPRLSAWYFNQNSQTIAGRRLNHVEETLTNALSAHERLPAVICVNVRVGEENPGANGEFENWLPTLPVPILELLSQ